MNQLLEQFVFDPENATVNFQLAVEYQNIGQTAAAASYYLRAAERANDLLLSYESFLKLGLIFETQGRRYMSARSMYQQAINICPHRPEGYFLLSRRYERDGTRTNGQNESVEYWFLSYNYSCIGLTLTKNQPPLKTWVEYPGRYGLEFEKAVSGWWCGYGDQSREIMQKLISRADVDEMYRQACRHNLEKLKNLSTT